MGFVTVPCFPDAHRPSHPTLEEQKSSKEQLQALAQVVLASMPLLRRPAACLRRPAAAPSPPPALPVVPAASTAFDIEAWEQQLDLGTEPRENERYVSTVYLATFARVLASTLAASPQLRDPRSCARRFSPGALGHGCHRCEGAQPHRLGAIANMELPA